MPKKTRASVFLFYKAKTRWLGRSKRNYDALFIEIYAFLILKGTRRRYFAILTEIRASIEEITLLRSFSQGARRYRKD